MSIQYIYLGYGTTDENGECKLDHDANGDSISHSYTGTGAGKIDVVASLDSPSSISDSSLVSETFSLYDCIKYDTGIQGSATNIYTNTTYLDRTSEYTNITDDSSNTTFIYVEISGDVAIEFDANVNVADANPFIAIANGGTVVGQKSQTNLGTVDDRWIHYRIEIKDNVATYTNDYSAISTTSNLTAYTRFRLRKAVGETFKFKNMMVYPI